MPKKPRPEIQIPWHPQLVGLALLAVVGSVIAYLVPDLTTSTSGVFQRTSAVSFHQAVALVLLTAITIVYLAYYRAKFSFSNRWLIAIVAYSALILFVKFTLSTHELTGTAAHDFGGTLLTAFLVSLIYIAAFSILYLFFDGRLLNKKLHKELITTSQGKILLAMGLFVCATVIRVIAFRLPGLSGTNASAYLGDVFQTNSTLLSGLIFLMIIGAVEAYAQVRRSIDLQYFYVSGVTLILIFHLWWAIFIYRGY